MQALPSIISDFLLRIANQCGRLDLDMTTNSVMLRKRYRDAGPDNWFGVFDSYGTWSVPNARNLYPLNIIKPMVRANTAALVTADIKVNIGPRVIKDTHAEMVADVARSIRDIKTEEQWTAKFYEQLCSEPQVSPGVFMWVDWDPNAPNHFVSSIDEWKEEEWSEGGRAVCTQCGAEQNVQDTMLGDATMPCMSCGGEAEVLEAPQQGSIDVIGAVKKFKNGNTTTKIIPSAEICIDDKATWGGNITPARWVLHRHLEPEKELKARYGQGSKMMGGTSTDWSYPLRWQYAMQTGNDQPYYTPSNWVDDLREVRDLYVTKEMYQYWEVLDFSVGKFKVNKTFEDATYDGQPVDGKTLCFKTVGYQVLDVYPCEIKDKLIYVNFLSNPSAFFGLFLTEMLPIQDVVNYMNSIQVFHTRRNARTTKVLDSGMFNPEDLEKDVVLTKEPLVQGENINAHFSVVPSVTLSQVPQMLLQSMVAMAPMVGGVTPAMTGQPQDGETWSAVRQQKEQSLGQLLPFIRSIALAKETWTLRQLKEAQANWTEEDFLFLLKLNSEWTEEYIEAFLQANLETDIIIEYEPGSDSPRNLIDREVALQQFLQTLGQLTQLSMSGSPIATPQLLIEILSEVKKFTQVDIDVDDFEAETRLADARSDKILAMTSGTSPNLPMPDLNLIASQLCSAPDLAPYPFEDHATEIEFYKDKIEQELSKDSPNHLHVACWYAMINSHQAAGTQAQTDANAAQVAATQPIAQAADAQAQSQSQAQAQAQAQATDQANQQELALEAGKQQLQGQRVQQDQTHAAVMSVAKHAQDMEKLRATQLHDAAMKRGQQAHDIHGQMAGMIQNQLEGQDAGPQ